MKSQNGKSEKLLKQETNRRKLGIYYTPLELTSAVCGWAIRSANDLVLEPSFGGCVFLSYASQALRKLGARAPYLNLYGCDIDKDAFAHLRQLFPHRKYQGRFLRKDFLSTKNSAFPSVDTVIGNPPYVSNHNMDSSQRDAARGATVIGPLSIPSTASLWAHFLNHSLGFLKEGGRLGLVLPGSAFQVDYGTRALEQLVKRFENVSIVSLGERVFLDRGAREATNVLLCDSWSNSGKATAPVREMRVKTLTELKEFLASDLKNLQTTRRKRRINNGGNLYDLTLPIARGIRDGVFRELGSFIDVRIGVVTGANNFFVLSQKQAQKSSLPAKALTPFFGRMKQAPGFVLTKGDLARARQQDHRCLLLSARATEDRVAVAKYLSTLSKSVRRKNKTFQKRTHWHRPDLGEIPAAFLSYMNVRGPRIVMNGARVQSLNNIHRLYANKRGSTKAIKLAAITLCSTLGQFATELVGRSYGDGVLKLEPSEARQLPIVGPHLVEAKLVNSCVSEIDRLMRAKKYEEAQERADKFVVEAVRALLNEDTLQQMGKYMKSLRAHRGLQS